MHTLKLFYISDFNYIYIYLARTPEIGQGLGCILSCGARKPEQTQILITFQYLIACCTQNQEIIFDI